MTASHDRLQENWCAPDVSIWTTPGPEGSSEEENSSFQDEQRATSALTEVQLKASTGALALTNAQGAGIHRQNTLHLAQSGMSLSPDSDELPIEGEPYISETAEFAVLSDQFR